MTEYKRDRALEILRLRLSGVTGKEIAKRYGITTGGVFQIEHKAWYLRSRGRLVGELKGGDVE